MIVPAGYPSQRPKHYHVVDGFFPDAAELRAAVDAHFASPFTPSHTQQIWNYWYVPGAYTYLRTEPQKVLPVRALEQLYQALREWALWQLGCAHFSPPILSLYVNGCGQEAHNDAENGRWAYVLSLTQWEHRQFVGGETQIFHPRPYWETPASATAGAGPKFYDLVEARFNRLIVFDDRLVHAVPRLQGTMDPRHGRVVLHGHFRESGAHFKGGLERERAMPTLHALRANLASRLAARRDTFFGVATLRLEIDAAGAVIQCRVLTDQFTAQTPDADLDGVRREIIRELSELRFPAASASSIAVVPLVFN
ncbi:hypothetical protein WA016_04186 [Myxococcus stipitatus]